MDNIIENDINFLRAIKLLDRIETPEFLFTFWRAIGELPDFDSPMIEKTKPWWNGIENLIILKEN